MTLTVSQVLAWNFSSAWGTYQQLLSLSDRTRGHADHLGGLLTRSVASIDNEAGTAFRAQGEFERLITSGVAGVVHEVARAVIGHCSDMERNVVVIRDVVDRLAQVPLNGWNLYITEDGRVMSRLSEHEISLRYGQDGGRENFVSSLHAICDQLTIAVQRALKEIRRIDSEANLTVDPSPSSAYAIFTATSASS